MKNILLILAITLIYFYPTSFAQSNVWINKRSMSTARTFLSSAVLDNHLFVIGGCPTTAATNKVEVYDPSTNTWSSVNNIPAARCYAMSCTYQGKIYVFGGSNGFWTNAEKSVYVYDPVTGIWSQKQDMPYAIGNSGIAVVGDTIYIIGGGLNTSISPVATVMGYDPVTETWTQKADLPTARASLSACVVNGKIYAIGGTTEDWNNVFYKYVDVYDPVSDVWSQKTDMPTGRWGLVTCAVKGIIYAIGGRAGAITTALNEAYDPATDSWLTKAPLQQGRISPAAGVIYDKIYVVGGHQFTTPMTMLSSLEEYTPDLVGVESNSDLLPYKMELQQNYPNPFNPSTKISWQLQVGSQATLKIYDLLGREIATLVNEYRQAGKYETNFNAKTLPSGSYFYQLKAGSFIETKKMLFMK